jgi:hypothetical protein
VAHWSGREVCGRRGAAQESPDHLLEVIIAFARHFFETVCRVLMSLLCGTAYLVRPFCSDTSELRR